LLRKLTSYSPDALIHRLEGTHAAGGILADLTLWQDTVDQFIDLRMLGRFVARLYKPGGTILPGNVSMSHQKIAVICNLFEAFNVHTHLTSRVVRLNTSPA